MAAVGTVSWVTANIVDEGFPTFRVSFTESISGLTVSDYTITGDVTSITLNAGGSSGTLFTYFTTRISSGLSDVGNGGSFRIQLSSNRVDPDLQSNVDYTLGWDPDGNTWAMPTADIPDPPELTLSLSESIVGVSEQMILTVDSTQDISHFIADDVIVTEGITKGALTEVNARQFTMPITSPASGNGTGVISIAENAVYPSNDPVSVSFTYVEEINIDISLSASQISHGNAITAQFDFDIEVPGFSEDVVTIGTGGTKGNATAIDDTNRHWILPVTVPDSGDGMLEISLEEDAIGLPHSRASAEIEFFQSRQLEILSADGSAFDPDQRPIINMNYRYDMKINGDGVKNVRVEGLLRPFYHHWNSSTGRLSIIGRPIAFYNDLDFTITAEDRSDNRIQET